MSSGARCARDVLEMRSRWQALRGPREVAAPQSARGAAAAGSWLMRGAVIAGMAGWAPVGKAATVERVSLSSLLLGRC